MSDNTQAAIERLQREQRRSMDIDLVARTVANVERDSFARTEIARTDAQGLAARQEIAARLGEKMEEAEKDFERRVEGMCRTADELEAGSDYVAMFKLASRKSYAGYLSKHFLEE